jgi:exopolysaccharide biosynthesis polyprenyl glycosylphosphotransferase
VAEGDPQHDADWSGGSTVPHVFDEPLDALDAELQTLLAARAQAREPVVAPIPPRRRRGRGWLLRRALVAADVFGCLAALLTVQLLVVRHHQTRDFAIDALMLLGLAGWVLLARVYGLYEHDQIGLARSTADDLPGLLLLSTLATWLGLLVLNATGLSHPSLRVAGTFWVLAIVDISAARAIARSLVSRRMRHREPTIIIGAGRVGARVAEKLAVRPEYGLEIVGFLDDDPLEVPGEGSPAYLGGTARLEQVIRAYEVERVIVAFSRLPGDAQVDLFRRCMELGVKVDIVPRMYEVIGSRMQVHDLDGLPLVGLRPAQLSRSARMLKRALDVTVAGVSLALLSPFMLFAAWRIKATSPGPVFFRQERMGAGGRRFQILKFRSMYIDAEERKREFDHLNKHTEDGPRMFKIPDDPRITPFGRFLRSTSLDELPQLLNVMRGEMSLVGPRPLILDEDKHIVGHSRRRLNLTPGITGLWQVLGRSDIPFSEMVTLDYLYVTNWSLWGDIKLLVRTLPAVMRGRGAY